jgi:hypothetical protein
VLTKYGDLRLYGNGEADNGWSRYKKWTLYTHLLPSYNQKMIYLCLTIEDFRCRPGKNLIFRSHIDKIGKEIHIVTSFVTLRCSLFGHLKKKNYFSNSSHLGWRLGCQMWFGKKTTQELSQPSLD